MSEVLSQSEIDNLLNALKNGELDVDEMKDKDENRSRIMISHDLLSSPRNISEPWR